jgi:hypothetical protein
MSCQTGTSYSPVSVRLLSQPPMHQMSDGQMQLSKRPGALAPQCAWPSRLAFLGEVDLTVCHRTEKGDTQYSTKPTATLYTSKNSTTLGLLANAGNSPKRVFRKFCTSKMYALRPPPEAKCRPHKTSPRGPISVSRRILLGDRFDYPSRYQRRRGILTFRSRPAQDAAELTANYIYEHW